ncbi:MAG: hypothetical protein ABJG41_20865 [Cyclobacteriaceae bacterium]
MKRIHFLLLALLLCVTSIAFGQSEALIDSGYDKYMDSDFVGAIDDFTRALGFDSTNAETYFLRGVCYSSINEKVKAVSDLNKAIELKADYYEAYYEKGFIFLSDQNAELAMAELDAAIKLNPDYAEAYVSRGTAKCMLEDKAGANADWAKAKDLGVGYTEYMKCE